jgi:phosphoribosylglycinamide formyltransferase-1
MTKKGFLTPNNYPRVAMFISGRGSNMEALTKAMQADEIYGVPALVISNNNDAEGLKHAYDLGIPTSSFTRADYVSKVAFESAILKVLQKHQIDWIALAGYMAIVGTTLLTSYMNRIINIHPSLLPAFKGLNPQDSALKYGVKYAGCTVHFVNEDVDGGAIIDQSVVEVKEDDTVQSLSKRILAAEHLLYPKALHKVISSGDVSRLLN